MATPGSELKHLGRYDIVSVLGKGAMGIVYAGMDSRLQRKVAIKTILKSALDADTANEYSMRFDREARAVARLNHPNIVQVYDFGEEADIAYIVMEFINGRELKAFFDAKERFALKEVVHIMGELCDALHFAHEAGIIHRDIKPANVMIDKQGRVKLADFGVARITDAERGTSEKTQAGAVIGTPAYMSPEQIEGGEIDRRTDIFSAGVVLYQFLTGEKPFTGEGAWTIAKKILQDDPPRPSSINQTVSPLFDTVVNKALAKNANARFQAARDLGIALKKALEGKPWDDDERTIVGSLTEDDETTIIGSPPPAVARMTPHATDSTAGRAGQATATQEMDLEFWRSIKDGDDPNDFDLYIEQFPNGIYTALAKRKSAKLRGQASEESTTRAAQAAEAERREIEDAARREAEAKAKLAEEKAKLEAELARREAEFQQRAAEAEARREAEAKARAEAEAEAKAEFEAALAKREAEMAERETLAKQREAEAKQREEEAKQREEEAKHREEVVTRIQKEVAKKKRGPIVAVILAVLVAVIFISYMVLKPAPTITEEELVKMLEQAKQANAELLAAKQQEQQMMAELAKTRQMEAEAKAAGDVEKQRQMAELAKQREADLQKQAELVKKREAEAQKQAELAKQRQSELEKQLASKKQASEKATVQKAAADKAAADKAAADKAAADKAAADKAGAEQRASAQRAASEKAAEKAAAEKAAAEKAAAAAAEKLAAEKAAAEKAAAEKAAAEKAAEKKGGDTVAAAKAVEKAVEKSASGEKVATLDTAAALLKQGQTAESNGDVRAAVKFYRNAARNGSGQAAKLLGDIYNTGKGDVGRDYQESLRWYLIAEKAGIKFERARSR